MDWADITGAVVIALSSVVVGWLLSLVSQSRQAEAQQRDELERIEREAAGEAIDHLLVLQRELPHIVGLVREYDEKREVLCNSELDRLMRLTMRFRDVAVRKQLRAVHGVLDWPDEVSQWGGPGVGWPRQIVHRTCSEGVDLLARYLRGEKIPSSPTSQMQGLMDAQATTLAEKQAQWEEEDRSRASGASEVGAGE